MKISSVPKQKFTCLNSKCSIKGLSGLGAETDAEVDAAILDLQTNYAKLDIESNNLEQELYNWAAEIDERLSVGRVSYKEIEAYHNIAIHKFYANNLKLFRNAASITGQEISYYPPPNRPPIFAEKVIPEIPNTNALETLIFVPKTVDGFIDKSKAKLFYDDQLSKWLDANNPSTINGLGSWAAAGTAILKVAEWIKPWGHRVVLWLVGGAAVGYVINKVSALLTASTQRSIELTRENSELLKVKTNSYVTCMKQSGSNATTCAKLSEDFGPTIQGKGFLESITDLIKVGGIATAGFFIVKSILNIESEAADRRKTKKRISEIRAAKAKRQARGEGGKFV